MATHDPGGLNPETHHRAILTTRFALALHSAGWRDHQPTGSIFKSEPESSGLATLPLSPDEDAAVRRIQSLYDTAVARVPAPLLTFPLPYPHDAHNAAHLPWASDARPSEFTPSFTDDASAVPIWKELVLEVASGRALSRPGLSYGLVFMVVGRSGKPRIIYWPRHLNAILAHLPVSYGSIRDLFTILTTVGIKVDLKSAFRSVRVTEDDTLYLAALVDGVCIIFTALPFGLASSPAIFTYALRDTLRRMGIATPATDAAISTLASFVDDLGRSAISTLHTLLAAETLIRALLVDGWWPSVAKSFLWPAANLYYTGMVAMFPRHAVAIHQDRATSLLHLISTITVPADLLHDANHALWDPVLDVLPPHVGGDARQPLPPATFNFSEPPFRLGTSTHIDRLSFAALRKLVGVAAWFQTILPYLCVWRRLVEEPVYSGEWSVAAVRALITFAAALPHLASRPRSILRPHPTALVITDASDTGWGAYVRVADTVVLLADSLPVDLHGASAPLREAYGARQAVRATFHLNVPFNSSHILMDALTVVGAADGGMRSRAFAPVLASFSAWEIQGLRLDFTHEGRDQGLHPLVDALSAAAAPPMWCLLPSVALDLWHAIGGWDVHLCTDYTHALAPAYTTAAAAGAREAVLARLSSSTPPSTSWGWLGHGPDAPPPPGTVAFAFPRWSHLNPLLARWREHRYSLLLIAPLHPADFWAPALVQFAQDCTAVWALPLSASYPPVELRPADQRLDPRPLAAYWYAGSAPQRLRGLPPFATAAPTPLACYTRGSALGTPADTAYARSGHCPGDGPLAGLLLATAAARPPTYSAPAPRADTRPRATSAPPPRATLGTLLAPPPTARTHRLHHAPPPTRPLVRPHARAPPAAPPAAAAAPPPLPPPHAAAPPPPPPPHAAHASPAVGGGEAVPLTLGTLTTRILAFAAGAAPHIVDTHVDPRLAPGLADAADAARRGHASSDPSAGRSRGERVPRYMVQLVQHLHAEDAPAHLHNIEALAASYAMMRLAPAPPLGWQRTSPPSVLADLSAFAAAATRAGVPGIPPYCGPRAAAGLIARGAKERPEHSAAFPIHLSFLLTAPPSVARDALTIMSFFCLRTGILPLLAREMLVAWDRGWIFIWRFITKRSRGNIDDPTCRSRIVHVCGARHPEIDRILARCPAAGPLFPTLTHTMLTDWVRTNVPGAPEAFDIRAYGVRVAADTEAIDLRAPKHVIDAAFWWKRTQKVMRLHYSSINVLIMYTMSEARASLEYVHFIPGAHACIARAPLPNWDVVVAVSAPPLPPAPTNLINAAWGIPPPDALLRMRGVGNPTAITCARCKAHCNADVPASLCDVVTCAWGLCVKCFPHGVDVPLRCPRHAE